MPGIILHIDVNSAFLSWSAIRLLESGSTVDLREIPAIVGGDQKTRHGIVVAKSIPAKRYGIHTADTVASAFRKCPTLVSVPPDHTYYREKSEALMDLLRNICPRIQQVSVDECFMDYEPLKNKFSSPEICGRYICDTVFKKLKFTVNVGISDRKILAKMASDFEKPNKVHTLFPDEIPVKMWPLPVRDLLFLGKVSEKKLTEAGIRTIGDLAREREERVQFLLGEKAGHQLYRYARGIDDSPVRAQPEAAKGFSVETTFNDDIVSMEQIQPVLLEQCDVLATRMRRKGKKCTCISVMFRTLDFKNRSHQTKLENPTDVTDEIYKNARRLFTEFWKGQPLRLIGVALTNLTEDSFEQLSLFEDTQDKERRQKLDAAMDAIRSKYGNSMITRASIMNSNSRIARKARAQMENELEENV